MTTEADTVASPPAESLRLLPKVELHCHVEGTARPATVAELAGVHGISLGVDEPEDLYHYSTLNEFLAAFALVCSVLRTPDDFHRLAYEAIVDGAAAGIVYREMFFSPGFHLDRGIRFDHVWAGLVAGIADAETDTGARTRLVLDVDKPKGLGPAMGLLEVARGLDRDILIGVGGDSTERGVDHAAFLPFIAEARNLGLRTTFHCGEDGPVDNVAVMVEAGVDRIDHGTRLPDDPELVRRVAEAGVPVTSCPTSNVWTGAVASLAEHPFAELREAGVLMTLNSDDPTFFGSDLADEYVAVASTFGYDNETMRSVAVAGVDGSWLDESDKAPLRRQIGAWAP